MGRGGPLRRHVRVAASARIRAQMTFGGEPASLDFALDALGIMGAQCVPHQGRYAWFQLRPSAADPDEEEDEEPASQRLGALLPGKASWGRLDRTTVFNCTASRLAEARFVAA